MKINNNIGLINKIHNNIINKTKVLQFKTIIFNTIKILSSLKIIQFQRVINKFK